MNLKITGGCEGKTKKRGGKGITAKGDQEE